MPIQPGRTRQVNLPLLEEQMKGLLKRYDSNGDGKLSRKDLKVVFKNLGSQFCGLRACRAIQHADRNKGSSVSLEDELDELVKYVMKWGSTIS
ncbi:conserved hypothetical protein [Ricinus communis]|uniref:EF-hand domain-containing protein n=1 Tax=Ricinus communis TaxID=3988 RepID=B9R7D2_RICCO|nr:conserved hypothetical protein [Ricinus communis]